MTDATDAADADGAVPMGGLPPSAGGLTGSTVGMAVGTTLSRITGIGRIVALTYVLGTAGAADAYNLANTTPNIIHDVVIGGVLAATFVPVFVDRLSTRRADDAWEAISAVTTATIALLAVATVAFWFFTPSIVQLYTATNHAPDRVQQRQVATSLLRWFVPQLACYGLIGLFSALLNIRHRFAAPMFVPIVNNLVVVVVLLWFHVLVPHPSLAAIQHQRHALVLLGIGTTVGVVVQAALLVPSLARAGLHLRFRWDPTHEAVRTIVRLASWTFAFVLSNQVALVVILALADGVKPQGAVTAYTYAYTFFLLPYGVAAVSLMSAVTPSLASRWVLGDIAGFRHRLTYGMRAMLAIIIPAAVGMLILAHPLIDLVLAHGTTSVADASRTASALAIFAIGLPGFCTYLYMIRVLQAMQDTRTACFLYLFENGVNIVAAVLLVGPLGVRGLALSVSIAYTVGAAVAVRVVGGRTGGFGGEALGRPLRRVTGATLVMAVVAVLAINVSSAQRGVALFGRLLLALVGGALAYVGTATVSGALHARRIRPGRIPRSPDDNLRRSSPPTHAYHPTPPYRVMPSGEVMPSGDPPDAADAPNPPGPDQFHDRIGDQAARLPLRHLRAVENHSGGDEEDVHGPGPDHHR